MVVFGNHGSTVSFFLAEFLKKAKKLLDVKIFC